MKKRSRKTCSNFKPISYLPNDLSTVRQSCCYCEYFNDKNCRKRIYDELEDDEWKRGETTRPINHYFAIL